MCSTLHGPVLKALLSLFDSMDEGYLLGDVIFDDTGRSSTSPMSNPMRPQCAWHGFC
jgi:hypothetical protein